VHPRTTLPFVKTRPKVAPAAPFRGWNGATQEKTAGLGRFPAGQTRTRRFHAPVTGAYVWIPSPAGVKSDRRTTQRARIPNGDRTALRPARHQHDGRRGHKSTSTKLGYRAFMTIHGPGQWFPAEFQMARPRTANPAGPVNLNAAVTRPPCSPGTPGSPGPGRTGRPDVLVLRRSDDRARPSRSRDRAASDHAPPRAPGVPSPRAGWPRDHLRFRPAFRHPTMAARSTVDGSPV